MKKLKAFSLVIMLILTSVALIGWGKKAASLLEDKPLINLSKAIDSSTFGNSGETDDRITEEETTAPTGEADNETQKDLISEADYVIRIRNEAILFENKKAGRKLPVKDVNELSSIIIKEFSSKNSSVIYVEDDFAEAHCYRNVLEVLKSLKNFYDIKFVHD